MARKRAQDRATAGGRVRQPRHQRAEAGGAGATTGAFVSFTVCVLAGATDPMLCTGWWPFVLAGAVVACAVGGCALALFADEAEEHRLAPPNAGAPPGFDPLP